MSCKTQFVMLRNTLLLEGADDTFILLDKMRTKWGFTPDKRVSLNYFCDTPL